MTRREQLLTLTRPIAASESVALKYAEHIEELFDKIIPDRIGSEYIRAIKAEDYTATIKACADYYRAKPDFPTAEISGRGEYIIEDAEKCLKGIARVVNIDWEFPDGEANFLFDPTDIKGPKNPEWVWQFNRHNEWSNIARTYTATGDERYAREFSKQLLRWIADTDIPEVWNAPMSAWRTIECGIRLLRTWPISYDGFRRSPSVSDLTLLLMIASMHRQCVHLVLHPKKNNWLMMESNGLYTFSLLFPELSDSEENKKLAESRLITELKKQILPDGMQCELSPDYQCVVFVCASNFYSLAKAVGEEESVPDELIELIKRSVRAAIDLSTPALTQPRTNDTFTIFTDRFTRRAEDMFGPHPEYSFINTKREEGSAPSGDSASRYLPYSGFVAMRSDWGEDASYLCFDVGPLGLAHEHQDMLNINIFKGKTELIFDDGGGQYDVSPQRKYAVSSYAHNVVLVDGNPQSRNAPLDYPEPYDAGFITNSVYDYARATYDGGFGDSHNLPATHKREVRFSKPDLFVVKDTLTATDDKPHDYELLLHLDTTSVKRIPEYNNAFISEFGGECEIVVIPLDGSEHPVELIETSGATEPIMQGWFNGRNEENFHKAITVSRKVSGVKDFVFNTLLIPTKNGEIPRVALKEGSTVSVSFGGREYTVDLNSLDA